MLISINTTNPDLSWIISKNPNSPPLAKTIRKGGAMGWFQTPQQYHITFFECLRSTGTVSWGRKPSDEFAYLYEGEYIDPVLGISLLNAFIPDVINKPLHEKDGGSQNTVTITSLVLGNFIQKIEKFLPIQYEVVDECLEWPKYKTVRFTNNGTLQSLLSNVSLFLLFVALDDRKSLDINPDLIEKYIGLMNKMNIPFYPRYLFKLKAGVRKKDLIEKLNQGNMQFCHLDTHGSRIDFALSNLEPNVVVADVGCGEGQYLKRVAKVSDLYIGIDPDVESLEFAKKKAERNHVENIVFYSNMNDVTEDIDTVICSEVIEHIPKEDVVDFVGSIISKFNPKKIILSTPNASFNVNYLFESGEMRHPDHKFEFTTEQFVDFCKKNFAYYYNIDVQGIGDKVGDEYCSNGAILTRK